MKEKLVEELDTKEKLQNLYESVHSVSTQDALSWFHSDIVASQNKEEFGSSNPSENTPYEISTSSLLGRYIEEFESLKLGCSD
ncbi:hypothetical protein IFM89_037589 [Coptis chinensis]|uniref:Uncharacterized protein n=1 Tax=Coptis chinensis TaxID=261450 RepID=A0A835H7N8_9MAGN|nr:hypothetical protein IFM89_037589 [Coptis chinensis]